MCYMCSSSISYMLTAACCGCIGSSKSRYLLCCSSSSVADLFRQDQIVMYITMQSLRELSWQKFFHSLIKRGLEYQQGLEVSEVWDLIILSVQTFDCIWKAFKGAQNPANTEKDYRVILERWHLITVVKSLETNLCGVDSANCPFDLLGRPISRVHRFI